MVRSTGDRMRVGIIGGGTIARLFLEQVKSGNLGAVEIVALAGRSENSRAKPLAAEFGVPFGIGVDGLLPHYPEVVVEAASHDAVRSYGIPLLNAGVSLIVLSAGALADDA